MRTAEEIVSTYENMLYRVALSHTGIREDAEDMVQETFLRWLQARPEFESDEHEKAWLLRVLINLCTNLVKKKGNRGQAELLDIYPAREEEEQYLIEEVLRLPPLYRDAIYLFYYENYSTAEIARIMGQKESTVRSYLHRGRLKLRRWLENEEI
ncbi:MAG: RNA polymerase sigma factor [Lachnospiraceae bacterium]|nr:RNA polymerase sigma factor [Lachnospiraceae bacterium]